MSDGTVRTASPCLTRREAVRAAALCAGALLLGTSAPALGPERALAEDSGLPSASVVKRERSKLAERVRKLAADTPTVFVRRYEVTATDVHFEFSTGERSLTHKAQRHLESWYEKYRAQSTLVGSELVDEVMYRVGSGKWKRVYSNALFFVRVKPGKTLQFKARIRASLRFSAVRTSNGKLAEKWYEAPTGWSEVVTYKNAGKRTVRATLIEHNQ